MPTQHITFSYTYSDLSDKAKQKAVEALAERRGGVWWDDSDRTDVEETMTMSLATSLKTPGHDEYGVSDFPGIGGVKIDGWSLDGYSYLSLTGTLGRENAPGLAWSDEVGHIQLDGVRGGSGTRIYVVAANDDPTIDVESWDAKYAGLRDTVRQYIDTALKAGSNQADWIASEEHAREDLEETEMSTHYTFHEDGSPFNF